MLWASFTIPRSKLGEAQEPAALSGQRIYVMCPERSRSNPGPPPSHVYPKNIQKEATDSPDHMPRAPGTESWRQIQSITFWRRTLSTSRSGFPSLVHKILNSLIWWRKQQPAVFWLIHLSRVQEKAANICEIRALTPQNSHSKETRAEL